MRTKLENECNTDLHLWLKSAWCEHSRDTTRNSSEWNNHSFGNKLKSYLGGKRWLLHIFCSVMKYCVVPNCSWANFRVSATKACAGNTVRSLNKWITWIHSLKGRDSSGINYYSLAWLHNFSRPVHDTLHLKLTGDNRAPLGRQTDPQTHIFSTLIFSFKEHINNSTRNSYINHTTQ